MYRKNNFGRLILKAYFPSNFNAVIWEDIHWLLQTFSHKKHISFQVRIHNKIVEMLAQAADSCPDEQLHRHILADSTKVYMSEVSDSNSAVGNFSK